MFESMQLVPVLPIDWNGYCATEPFAIKTHWETNMTRWRVAYMILSVATIPSQTIHTPSHQNMHW